MEIFYLLATINYSQIALIFSIFIHQVIGLKEPCTFDFTEVDCKGGHGKFLPQHNVFQIESLNISDSDMTSITAQDFTDYVYLNSLFIENTTLPNVTREYFLDPLISLETLQVSRAEISDEFLKKLADIPQLRTLSLNNMSIPRLEKNFFISMNHIKNIDLRYCNISAFEKGTFDDLPTLKTVDLSYNNIGKEFRPAFTSEPGNEKVCLVCAVGDRQRSCTGDVGRCRDNAPLDGLWRRKGPSPLLRLQGNPLCARIADRRLQRISAPPAPGCSDDTSHVAPCMLHQQRRRFFKGACGATAPPKRKTRTRRSAQTHQPIDVAAMVLKVEAPPHEAAFKVASNSTTRTSKKQNSPNVFETQESDEGHEEDEFLEEHRPHALLDRPSEIPLDEWRGSFRVETAGITPPVRHRPIVEQPFQEEGVDFTGLLKASAQKRSREDDLKFPSPDERTPLTPRLVSRGPPAGKGSLMGPRAAAGLAVIVMAVGAAAAAAVCLLFRRKVPDRPPEAVLQAYARKQAIAQAHALAQAEAQTQKSGESSAERHRARKEETHKKGRHGKKKSSKKPQREH